jgi:threonine/homoserine/homoserine lactone efflux protein
MVASGTLAAFALVALGLVLTPGPNMVYLISRSIAQGRTAGAISLAGVAMASSSTCWRRFGLTPLLLAVPFAYDAIRWAARISSLPRLECREAGARRAGAGTTCPSKARPSVRHGISHQLLNPMSRPLPVDAAQFIDPAMGTCWPGRDAGPRRSRSASPSFPDFIGRRIGRRLVRARRLAQVALAVGQV